MWNQSSAPWPTAACRPNRYLRHRRTKRRPAAREKCQQSLETPAVEVPPTGRSPWSKRAPGFGRPRDARSSRQCRRTTAVHRLRCEAPAAALATRRRLEEERGLFLQHDGLQAQQDVVSFTNEQAKARGRVLVGHPLDRTEIDNYWTAAVFAVHHRLDRDSHMQLHWRGSKMSIVALHAVEALPPILATTGGRCGRQAPGGRSDSATGSL